MKTAFSRILLAKEPSGQSGGAGPATTPSRAKAADGAVEFLPITDQQPKYGQPVLIKVGGETVEGVRDPLGWFTKGHASLIEGVPESFRPL